MSKFFSILKMSLEENKDLIDNDKDFSLSLPLKKKKKLKTDNCQPIKNDINNINDIKNNAQNDINNINNTNIDNKSIIINDIKTINDIQIKNDIETKDNIKTANNINNQNIIMDKFALAVDDPNRDYNYIELLQRVYLLARDKNPNSVEEKKRNILPLPQLIRVGTKKMLWANFNQICQIIKRSVEHLQQFLFAELGTEGSIDGNQRLIIKGRYQSKQIESLLKKYIVEYVQCHMCKKTRNIINS